MSLLLEYQDTHGSPVGVVKKVSYSTNPAWNDVCSKQIPMMQPDRYEHRENCGQPLKDYINSYLDTGL